MATNRATSWLHLRSVVYIIVSCISTSSSDALVLDGVSKIWPCPAACNCTRAEGSNRYLALCAGGSAAFMETLGQLSKDITNFTFVLQNPGASEDHILLMPELSGLINLKTFIITSTLQDPFKYFPYNFYPFKSINLTTLRINIHIPDMYRRLNCCFAMLEEFDLSSSRMEIPPPSAIYDLLKSTSPGRLRVLNFHHSIAATYPFGQLKFSKFFKSSRRWERLEKFDFSQNGVTSLLPGVYRKLPKLKYIDLSNNLIAISNKGTQDALLELLLHPMLEVINLANQKEAEIAGPRTKDSIRRVESMWKACLMNIGVQDAKHLCYLLSCTLLRALRGYFPCDQVLPGTFDLSSQCFLGIYFPLGQNIRELYLSRVFRRLHQGPFSDFPSAPKYCVHPNNSLEVFDLSDNYLGQLVGKDSNITEICLSGFTNLRYFNLQNNKIPVPLSSKCDFANLEVLLLGGNRMPFQVGRDTLLPTMPLLRILDLANNGIENFPILLFDKLFHLQELNLSCNSLTNLDLKLPVSREMRLLNVSGNNLTGLPYRNMQQLDNHIANLSVDMTNNPFMCGCDDIKFVQWVQTTKLNLVRREDYLCYNEHIGQVSLVDVDTDALHKTCNPPVVQIVLGSSFGTLLLISLVFGIFFMYHKRWYLRYKLYLLMSCWRERYRQVNDRDEFLYDDFVIYNNEDR